ncbi:MAG: ribosomal protein S18 acetylase RimI-like enzyme [Planctomycetaceae bacterium]
MNQALLKFRKATEDDLPTIVSLLSDDPLGALREDLSHSLSPNYRTAFQAITSDPNHELLVADIEGAVVGVLQLSFIPHLTYEGGWRAQIEGVRVSEEHRSRGVGRALFESAISRARDRGCHLVQLTTDRRRPEALKFYIGLGFESTHDGLKLHLERGTL